MESSDPRDGGPRVQTIHSGKWLHYRVAEFRDPGGRLHRWEYVDRQGSEPGALMVALCRPSGDLILVRQYRAPLGRDTVEFPAGLVGEGTSIEETAVRELKEETGYRGRVTHVGPVLCSSAGLTSERIYLVHVEIDETDPENRAPEPASEERERIQVLRVPMAEAPAALEVLTDEGVVIDSRVWAYLTGHAGEATGSRMRQGGAG